MSYRPRPGIDDVCILSGVNVMRFRLVVGIGSTIDVVIGFGVVFWTSIVATSVLGSFLSIFHVRVTESPETSCVVMLSLADRSFGVGLSFAAAAGAIVSAAIAAVATAMAAVRAMVRVME